LRVNDTIEAVNGIPSSQLSGWDFGRLLRRPPGTNTVLSLSASSAGSHPMTRQRREPPGAQRMQGKSEQCLVGGYQQMEMKTLSFFPITSASLGTKARLVSD
jgi:C-terminal processing protease CtpA/Prc